MFFRLASGSTMCDINSRALGGTNIGQVKLNVATVNSQTSFVIITTSYGLDSGVSGGIIRIKVYTPSYNKIPLNYEGDYG